VTLKQCMNMNLKSDNQKIVLEGNQGLKKLEKEIQNKQEIVENVKTEMALLQAGTNMLVCIFSMAMMAKKPYLLILH